MHMTDELLEEILCIFTSEEKGWTYPHLQEPYHQHGYIVATDRHVAIRVKNNETSKVYETYLIPNVVDQNWEPNTKIRVELDFLDALRTEKRICKACKTKLNVVPYNTAIEINNVTFDPNLLYKLREVVKLTGQECHLLQNHNGNFVGTMFEVGIFEMIVMPKIFDKEDVKIIKLV